MRQQLLMMCQLFFESSSSVVENPMRTEARKKEKEADAFNHHRPSVVFENPMRTAGEKKKKTDACQDGGVWERVLDEGSGSYYEFHSLTGESRWLDTDSSDNGNTTLRKQYVRYETIDDEEYFAEVGTQEVVWKLPEDGELVSNG
jgi:hypothetical protein